MSKKPKYTIIINIRSTHLSPTATYTVVGRKRAFKDAAQLILSHWVHQKHARRP